MKYEGIQISPGYVNKIAFKRTFYEKLPSPYSNCRADPLYPALISDSKFYKLTLSSGNYSQNQCFEVCFQYKYAIPNCNCSDPSINSNVNNISVFHTQIDLMCLSTQRSTISSANCLASCPEVCDRVEYD